MEGLTLNQEQKWIETSRSQPIVWINKILGISRFSKGQAKILAKIPEAIKRDVPIVVPSGNAQGKDFISSCIAPWFLYNYMPSKVIITAPTDRQVKEIMWGELETRWNNALVELPGRILTCKIDIEPNWFMIGFTTKETGDMTGKAQGFHSEHICVIASEAQAIQDNIFEQLDSILNARVNLFIMIGNPLRTAGVFAKAIKNTTNNIVIPFDCLESPNYTQQKNVIPGMASYNWIEKKRREWDPEGTGDHPLWRARIRGLLPKSSIDTIFSPDLVDKMVTQVPKQTIRKIVTSIDPAGMGVDEQVIYGNISGRIIQQDILAQTRAPESCSRALQMTKLVGANMIVIDADGMGQPIADFIYKIKPLFVTLLTVNSNSKDKKIVDEEYFNLKAQMWFYAKEQAELGYEQIPDDEYLKQELMEMKYFFNPRNSKIQIESKEDLRDRIGRSPNRADAWVLNVWGRKTATPIKGKQDAWGSDDVDTSEVSAGAESAMTA